MIGLENLHTMYKGIIADNTESVWSLGQLIRNFYKIKESGETNNALKSSFLYTITSCIEQIDFYVKQRFYRFPGSWAHQATQMVWRYFFHLNKRLPLIAIMSTNSLLSIEEIWVKINYICTFKNHFIAYRVAKSISLPGKR